MDRSESFRVAVVCLVLFGALLTVTALVIAALHPSAWPLPVAAASVTAVTAARHGRLLSPAYSR